MSATDIRQHPETNWPRWHRWLLVGLTALFLAAPALPVSAGQLSDQPGTLVIQAECQDDHCS